MTATLAVAPLGWTLSAALALVLARRRACARRRGDELAAVVHELRGPLQAAGMIVATVRRGAPPEVERALSALEVELGRLALAVADLDPPAPARVMPARVPAPRGSGAGCDAAALVRELAPGWRVLATAHGRALRVSAPLTPLWVGAERLRLAQALGNLVANALEHGAGDVDVRLAPGPDGGARAEVCDGGAGLPASVAALVARPPDPRRPRGRGLGIAARIAADAGGRLRSAPAARGARLVLELPGRVPEPAPVRRRAVPPAAPRPRPTQPVAS